MQVQIVAMLALLGGVLGKPNYKLVNWFEMKPAVEIRTKPHQDNEPLARISFDVHQEWENFKTKHGKKYKNIKEDMARFSIFNKSLKYIVEHNKRFRDGKKSFYLGVNQFADMENYEFRMYNGLRQEYNRSKENGCSTYLGSEYLSIPSSVDWREKGYVTPVKNQGQCGSCWSFSTTGSVEGQHFRKTANLVSLSEQQLVDCSGTFGNEGCNGGLMDNAFNYIKLKGIETEDDYPYDAEQEKCHYDKSEVAATVTGCVDVESGSEAELKKAVADVGPVSIAIDASHQSFQLYKGGVYDEPDCSSTQLDHGVLTVGYGTQQGEDYWIVKNSWGISWGENGYVKMSRNRNNQCGVATQASYPLV